MGYRKRNSFTMVEVLIVIIIVAILASMSYPVFRKAIEKSGEKFAKTNLRLILAGENLYRLNYYHYYPKDESGKLSTDVLTDINNYLNLDLKEKKYGYTYEIKVTDNGNKFTATAIKDGTPKFDIDQDGNITPAK
jgi:prepilin-type N-terminal cleavage/methylation domain-containing protein